MTGRHRLGEILVSRGLADPRDVYTVLGHDGTRKKLGSELYRLGAVTERGLCLGLAEQQGHPAVVLSESSLDLEALRFVPRLLAEELSMLPIAIDATGNQDIVVAVPFIPAANERSRMQSALDQLSFANQRSFRLLVAVEEVLREAVPLAYDAARAGERVLVGTSPRPSGTSTTTPLSIVRQGDVAPKTPPLMGTSAGTEVLVGTVINRVSMSMPTSSLVLVADSDEERRADVVRLLRSDGAEVQDVGSGRAALQALRGQRPKVLVIEAFLPDLAGHEIVRLMRQAASYADMQVVLLGSAHNPSALDSEDFIHHPVDLHHLRQSVANRRGKPLSSPPLPSDWAQKVRLLAEDAQQAVRDQNWPHAVAVLARWRTLDPLAAGHAFLQGQVHWGEHDPMAAMRSFEQAVAFDPALYLGHRSLAAVADQLGYSHRASRAWYRAYELAPDDESRRDIEAHLARH
jgi:CheY-like chemotaxis protein